VPELPKGGEAVSNIYDAMRRDLESAMANVSRPNGDELRRLRKENKRLHSVNAELLEALKALTVAVTFADPPKEFNGVLCHEARVPVGFVDAVRAAVAKAEEVKP
jgi:hypothetical protein